MPAATAPISHASPFRDPERQSQASQAESADPRTGATPTTNHHVPLGAAKSQQQVAADGGSTTEPSLPRVPGLALMRGDSHVPRRWPRPHLATLQHGEASARQTLPKATDSCPSPCEAARGERKQLCATCTWQHVVEAGAGFGVAQQRLWSEDYQLEWRIRGRARWSALPETPPRAATCLPPPIPPEQGSSCQRFASHSAAVLCQIGHPLLTAPTIPAGVSPGEEAEGLPGTCLSHGWS